MKYPLLILLLYIMSCQMPVSDRYCKFNTGLTVNTINRINKQELSSNDSIQSNSFSLLFKIQSVINLCQKINDSYNSSENIDYCFDTIKNITISSNQDFNATHLAGTSLNKYFIMPDSIWYEKSHLLKDIPAFEVILIKSPETIKYHSFTISIEVAGKDSFKFTTSPIKLLN